MTGDSSKLAATIDSNIIVFLLFCIDSILNKTILGDCLEVIPLLPNSFIDLLIVDPPYNLDKDFHGKKFKKTSDDVYEEYTETWVKAIIPHLKKEATIYVCCDFLVKNL